MPKINLLPKQLSELIAAGEVVERPASVIKELVENSIDAGADSITVEIKHGGISYIRITDNGCGIAAEDVPTAFLRHATSKIKKDTDLDSISTLGFRGEALAAVSSVSRTEMFTKPQDAQTGTHYVLEGGVETLNEEAGCPNGTTIIIRDLFYNTPARMKFLKKDVSEANAAAAVTERIALSHPEIAFKLIRDGKQTLVTAGDGKTASTVYSVLGREFAGTLIPLNSVSDYISVEGLTCKPFSCRATRNYQFTFLNGRLVRSATVTAAAEQAYKNSAMVGKFPGFVIYVTVPFEMVDVNVHPAKTEVRFSDEKRVFDAVYHAVKNAINTGDTRPEIKLKAPTFNPFERIKAEEYRNEAMEISTVAERAYQARPQKNEAFVTLKSPTVYSMANSPKNEPVTETDRKLETKQAQQTTVIVEEKAATSTPEEERTEVLLIGEAFSTYIIVQSGNSIFMIDKHAAHERILFNDLKSNNKTEVQALLSPVTVTLDKSEYAAVLQGKDELFHAGFEVEDFGDGCIRVLTVPSSLTAEDVPMLISELAEGLMKTGRAEVERIDDIFHTVVCRAAIKAGNKTSPQEMKMLAERVLNSNEIRYCPHGRPVAFEIKKRELEKQFGRIQ